MKLIKKSVAILLSLLTVFALSVTAMAADKSADQIKAIVLADAGVNAADVNTYFARIDYDDLVKTWDVDFTVKTQNGYVEYEYDVRAADGVILGRSREVKAGVAPVQGDVLITKEAALANAYAAFAVNGSDAKYVKVVLENDDGIRKYEIRFVIGNTEYECEVSATTGDVYEMDTEPFKAPAGNLFAKLAAFFERILNAIRNLFK